METKPHGVLKIKSTFPRTIHKLPESSISVPTTCIPDSVNMPVVPKPSFRLVEIGERYMVQWRNGQYIPGDIIEIRPLKKRLESGTINELEPEAYEYYVHYPSYDRRLDEWVTYDRIDLQTMVVAANSNESEDTHPQTKIAKKSSSSSLIKRKYEDISVNSNSTDQSKRENQEALLAKLEKEHEEITKVKNINTIVLGKYLIDTWYFSPYPDEYCGEDKLRICEYCLKYMKRQSTFVNHMTECTRHTPPGREIYRENELSMYEIDGKEHKIYCQNLCLLSKLFLDHKTLYYDVDPFLFYVLCEVDEEGSHIVGYFSKEKHSQENYNLACILTFPPYQRKGYGKILISISYEITKRENTTGSPEKPLSDLGRISYRSYWAYVILKYFQENLHRKQIVPNEIAKATGIRCEDIISTLHSLSLIRYWKGQHIIKISTKEIELQLVQASKIRLCNPDCLNWQPQDRLAVKKNV
jgi:histone acetyltransferase MYST1